MATTTLVPVEDYLRLTDKPNAEYRDGVVIPKAMPTKHHSRVQLALAKLLESQGVEAFPELTLRLSSTKFLVPDVAVANDFPGAYPTERVQLCCEILSPEERIGSTLGKCDEYHAWGVPFCWVIDPLKRTAWQYHNGSEPTRVIDALRAGPLTVSLEELFSALPPE